MKTSVLLLAFAAVTASAERSRLVVRGAANGHDSHVAAASTSSTPSTTLTTTHPSLTTKTPTSVASQTTQAKLTTHNPLQGGPVLAPGQLPSDTTTTLQTTTAKTSGNGPIQKSPLPASGQPSPDTTTTHQTTTTTAHTLSESSKAGGSSRQNSTASATQTGSTTLPSGATDHNPQTIGGPGGASASPHTGPTAPLAPFYSTSTPGCSGTGYKTVFTTTVTVTEGDDGHYAASGPVLILPQQACTTSAGHHIDGGNPVGPPPVIAQSTATITATVKTAQSAGPSTYPPVTFGAGGAGAEPIQGGGWNGGEPQPVAPTNTRAQIPDSPHDGGPAGGPAVPTQTTAQAQATAAVAVGGPSNAGTQPAGNEPAPQPASSASNSQSTGLGGAICQAFGGCAGAGPVASPAPDAAPAAVPAAGPAANNVNNVPVAVQPSGVQIGSSTFAANAPTAQVAIVSGQTFTVLPSNGGVVAPGDMTISQGPNAVGGVAGATAPPAATVNGVVFAADPANANQIVVAGSTIARPLTGSTTITAGGQVFTIGPSQVVDGSSTVALPVAAAASSQEWIGTTVDNVGLDIGTAAAIIGGTIIPIGPNAAVTTITTDGVEITLGPQGVVFPGTTISPLVPTNAGLPFFAGATGETVSADGAFFSFAPTDVVIDGTTYPYATPTEVVVGGGQATVSIGTNGLHLLGTPTPIAPAAANSASGRHIGDSAVALLAMLLGAVML